MTAPNRKTSRLGCQLSDYKISPVYTVLRTETDNIFHSSRLIIMENKPVACKKYDSNPLNPVFSMCNINALELLIVFGIAGNGTCLHCTIPRSGAGLEHVQRGLKVHGGYFSDSISLARTVAARFRLANIIRIIVAIIRK